MKRLIIIFTLTLVLLNMHATGQDGDIIYIDGVQWELLGKYIGMDKELSHGLYVSLPKERVTKSSNWSGYTAYWSIRQDKVYLDSIKCERYEGATKKSWMESIPKDTLLRVFKNHCDGNDIVASWITGKIRTAKGKMIYYQHSGFERNYEEEQILSLDHGKVTERQVFQNYVTEGFSFDHYNPKNHNELREMFPLHTELYPELADVKRIVFSVKRARVDATGHLVDCEVRVLKPGDNPKLAAEMAEAMKAYHPWHVMFINGEYRGYGIEGYTLIFPLNDNED